jgi:L-rhamnose-H+ transport protein
MTAIFGAVLAVLAGTLVGSFSLPMKKTTKWAWENTWLVWAFTALLVVPWTVALWTVPALVNVLCKSDTATLLLVFVFGAGWGLGAVFFGRSIAILGMSLAFAISMGLTIALGAIIPMVSNPAIFTTDAGIVVTVGIALMVFSVIICAFAGNEKEKKSIAVSSTQQTQNKSGLFIKGMVLCVLSGIFNPMINFAFVFGGRIITSAVDGGASQASAADALWAVALLGGLVTNIVYCSTLLTRNKTWPNYLKEKTISHWPLAIIMGVVWVLSVTVYGRAAFFMGALGNSAGWAIYLGFCIFISNFWGIITGEWKQGKGKPLNIMYAGLAMLIAAVIIIGWGNSL